MTDAAEIRQSYLELAHQWSEVEMRLKEVEQRRSEVVHAAVNEMRYAGRVMADAAVNLMAEEPDYELAKRKIIIARQYITNADHDITDATMFFLHAKVKRLIEAYPKRALRKEYKNIDILLDKIDIANKIVRETRQNRFNREEKYKILKNEYIPFFLREYEKIDIVEKIALTRQLRQRYILFASVLITMISILTATVSMIAWLK